ncbi:Maf-like protein [Vibrio sp. Of7-15]|uniref:Maf family protein n=1 Tax=Vibrio sp. Of7-15 TaxID=2724879 RepID=UPI001EF34695|nr:nucleoside triphosphate pyrophosphatase [Vibrio sp. Of7-15]MCG7496988.1 Maf-like protein [Vibrio sp. Of7-15]
MKPTIVLASTSPFRRSILEKLQIPFICVSPNCDETPFDNEPAMDLVKRLAEKKARSCNDLPPNSLIIGSDQVCVINEKIVGKPHTKEKAIEQLSQASGQCVSFYTGLSLYNNTSNTAQTICEVFKVHFRELTPLQIENYIEKEQPLNCAGSFKSEGLGIALFDRLEGKDPNTLIGLPLISLIDMLETENYSILK